MPKSKGNNPRNANLSRNNRVAPTPSHDISLSQPPKHRTRDANNIKQLRKKANSGKPSSNEVNNGEPSRNEANGEPYRSEVNNSEPSRNEDNGEQLRNGANDEQSWNEANVEQPKNEANSEQLRNEANVEQPRNEANVEQPRNEANVEQPRNEANGSQPGNNGGQPHGNTNDVTQSRKRKCCCRSRKCVVDCCFTLLIVVFMIFGVIFTVAGVLLAFVPDKTIYILVFKVFQLPTYTNITSPTYPGSPDEMKDMPLVYEFGLSIFIFGICMFIISFLGSILSCLNSFATKHAFRIFILLTIIMSCFMLCEITVGTMFLVKSSQIHGGITSKYKNRIKEDFNEEGTDPFSKCINLMNYLFQCCGIDSVADFGTKKHKSCKTNVVGCYTKLIDNIQINIIYVGLVFAFILIIQLCYFVLFVLAWKNKYRSISSVEPEQRNDIAEDVDPANVQDTPVEVFHITPRVLRNNELGISEC